MFYQCFMFRPLPLVQNPPVILLVRIGSLLDLPVAFCGDMAKGHSLAKGDQQKPTVHILLHTDSSNSYRLNLCYFLFPV